MGQQKNPNQKNGIGGIMKTERDFGYETAEAMQEPGYDGPVDIDKEVRRTVSIPEGDYLAMREAGIENPNAREYWRGFNSFFEVPPTATVMVRKVPVDLQRKFKSRCAALGVSQQAKMVELIRAWVNQDKPE